MSRVGPPRLFLAQRPLEGPRTDSSAGRTDYTPAHRVSQALGGAEAPPPRPRGPSTRPVGPSVVADGVSGLGVGLVHSHHPRHCLPPLTKGTSRRSPSSRVVPGYHLPCLWVRGDTGLQYCGGPNPTQTSRKDRGEPVTVRPEVEGDSDPAPYQNHRPTRTPFRSLRATPGGMGLGRGTRGTVKGRLGTRSLDLGVCRPLGVRRPV